MTRNHHHPSSLSDICLLLRAHAEQSWLSHEILPVLRQLEQPGALPEEQLGAALAYLEVLCTEAAQRAAETEAAHAELEAAAIGEDGPLSGTARGYHAAVCGLRDSVADQVAQAFACPADPLAHDHAEPQRDRVRFREWRRGSIFSPTPPTQTARWRQPG
jgi:hypothetical protein